MREQVTLVIRVPVDDEQDDWELHGIYVTPEDAANAIAFAERHESEATESVYATFTGPVLSFPEWVR
jgi:hypothetical protein